jgi:hypothetical protein
MYVRDQASIGGRGAEPIPGIGWMSDTSARRWLAREFAPEVRELPCNDVWAPEQVPQAAAVIDLDNVLHRGGRSRLVLDVINLTRELRHASVVVGTVCCHYRPAAMGELLWCKFGFNVVAANDNCDPQVIAAAIGYGSRSDINKIVLIAGDGGYCPMVDQLQQAGIGVEVWARRSSLSTKLARCAAQVRWIDQFLSEKTEISAFR